jgi:hypothetical protein
MGNHCSSVVLGQHGPGITLEALKDGTIDFVVPDYNPCVAGLKKFSLI